MVKTRKMEENPMSHSWEGFTSQNPLMTCGTVYITDPMHESLMGVNYVFFSDVLKFLKLNVSD